ncbi:LysM peptidoglycan-binding domain-containing protein [Spirosoma taeanense]|uniref:LysM peptidoglycan-binding domain-containing protein n=2 Tax=Spirosoma taeanense TaxID=2735870 RepID=A0A6M5YGH4_9BACT|nr:LysM peptidoglycan-binding domain-containing protein [Spirosoma taeanense]
MVLVVCFFLSSNWAVRAQSVPEVPFDLNFAGVTVHVNEPGRRQIQQEVARLYENRTDLYRQIDALRQLTPLLEPLLTSEHLHSDFRYAILPAAETDSTAYWGLTAEQGANLGLRMTSTVDERLHPILATEVVTSRLSQLYEGYGNAVRALLEYLQSSAPANLRPDKADPMYLMLDPQSPPLIWKILARKIVFEREEPAYRSATPYVLYEYQNGVGQLLRTIARQLAVDEERFQPFNAWLKGSRVPTDKEYSVLVRVTPDEYPVVKKAAEGILKARASHRLDIGFPMLVKLPSSAVKTRFPAVFYNINERLGVQAQPCDNLITLAYYGKLTIDAFLNYNELTDQDVIQPGQIYYLEIKARRAKVPFHVVQKNQTLREIANIYGVRLRSLLRFNRIAPTQRVQTGRIIWMREKRPLNRPVEYQQLPVREAEPIEEDTVTTVARTEPPAAPADSLIRQQDNRLAEPSLPQSATNTVADPDLTGRASEPVSELPDSSWNEPKENLRLHIVKPGQTYYAIARLYGVTVRQLYIWNNLSERIPLEIGQELIIDLSEKPASLPRIVKPSSSITKAKKVIRKPRPASAKPVDTFVINPSEKLIFHIVKPGQTVYRIALINKVSVDDLMRWNNLKDYTIEVGQRLVIRKRK